MSKYKGYNKYEVTFTQKSKYNPVTRSVVVHALNEYHATLLVHGEFGSFTKSRDKILQSLPSDKVKIEGVKQIKEEVAEVVNA